MSVREAIRRSRHTDRVYRVLVGVLGGLVVLVGIVLMPLPGPGTLIVLGGLAILATEFEGARRASRRLRRVAEDAVRRAGRARDRRRAR